jgi:lipopolysaccharide transport system ATP-binding protein
VAADITLAMQSVSKRFKKGEMYDSLRDLVPGMVRRLLGRGPAADTRDFWALRDVSFEILRGEAVGIVGNNGAGKSTILKILSGIMKPTLGEMTVRGRLSALIEVGAGFHPDLTGRENVYLNGAILGMTRAEVRRKFDEIVEFSGLSDFIDTPVKRYSSGMFARLGFSVAAHVDPDVLIVDEVLSVGDYVFQQKCAERMTQVVTAGATVVFVSHNLHAVSDLCTRTVWLHQGQVAKIGPTADVIRAYLDRARQGNKDAPTEDAFIADVRLKQQDGKETVAVQAGDTVTVEVEIRARARCERLSVGVQVYDDASYNVFNTSTERLGCPSFVVTPEQPFRTTFELHLHLGAGTYLLGVNLHRYDVQKQYDHHFPAATFFVRNNQDVRGAANLYPRVAAFGPVLGAGT